MLLLYLIRVKEKLNQLPKGREICCVNILLIISELFSFRDLKHSSIDLKLSITAFKSFSLGAFSFCRRRDTGVFFAEVKMK